MTEFDDLFGGFFGSSFGKQRVRKDLSYRYCQDDDRRWRWELVCTKEKPHTAFLRSTRYWYAKEDCVTNCHYWLKILGFEAKEEKEEEVENENENE